MARTATPSPDGATGVAAGRGDRWLTAAALAVVAAALAFTWYKLFFGVDLRDESFAVLVPWRWALGDRPFVDELNLAQLAGLFTYPFAKLFAILSDGSSEGLILFTRHLYLVSMVAVAAAVAACLRCVLRWQLAAMVSALLFTCVLWNVPNITYNTLAVAFLTLGFALGIPAVVGRQGGPFLLLAGVCHGLAAVRIPPSCSSCRSRPCLSPSPAAASRPHSSRPVRGDRCAIPSRTAPRRAAERGSRCETSRSAWPLPVAACAAVVLGFGLDNVRRSLHFTLLSARDLDQLSGARKAVGVAFGISRFAAHHWLLIAAGVGVLVVLRYRPRLARLLLLALPVALYLVADDDVQTAGFVLVYGLAAPFLLAFVPEEKRTAGAQLLLWIWAPAVLFAAMTGYTSADGYLHGAVGLFPALLVSGTCYAWALEAAVGQPGAERGGESRSGKRLAILALAAVVAVTIVFQFKFQANDEPFAHLTTASTSGPWRGVRATPAQVAALSRFDRDLQASARPGDSLLVYYREPGLYLYWSGPVAADSVSIISPDPREAGARLPVHLVDSYRGRHAVPSLVVHVLQTAGLSSEQLRALSGGLDYPVVVTRPWYTIHRRPPGDSRSGRPETPVRALDEQADTAW